MNLKVLVVIVLLLQALALPVLAAPPSNPPTRGINFSAGNLSFPNWNYGYCYYSEAAGDTYYFWVYNPSNQLIAVFFTRDAAEVTLLSQQCGVAHYVNIYCPDAACEWTALVTYPYGAFPDR